MRAEEHSAAQQEPAVRPMEPGDSEAVVRMASAAPEAAGWPEESYAKLAERGLLGWVAVAEGTITGFLLGRRVADEAEILNLVVAPEHRRRGRASCLVGAALDEFRRRGVRHVYLEVRESNGGAICFYRGRGFRVSGRRPGYYENPREDAVCMVLGLSC